MHVLEDGPENTVFNVNFFLGSLALFIAYDSEECLAPIYYGYLLMGKPSLIVPSNHFFKEKKKEVYMQAYLT